MIFKSVRFRLKITLPFFILKFSYIFFNAIVQCTWSMVMSSWNNIKYLSLNPNTFFVVVDKFSKNIKKVRIILYNNNTFKSYSPHLAHFHYRSSAIGTRGRWSRGANFYCSIISRVFGEGKESSIIKWRVIL